MLLLSFAAPAVAAERSFPVSGFTEIVLAGSPDVTVTTGGLPLVMASGEAADLDRLDIRVDGRRLLIGTRPGRRAMSRKGNVRIRVSTAEVSAAVVSGSGSIRIDRVSGPFSGRISGSGEMSLPAVDSSTLTLAISGSGDMDAAGRCGSGNFSISGSGDIDAAALNCADLTATTTGSGDIEARATGRATLRVTGSGDILVSGGARCTSRSTGSGTTRCG
jgi:hypothetical protein